MGTILSVAGSDSIGGAGVQADLKAIASMDLHGASVITAITAQNTQHVAKIKAVPTVDIQAQLNAVLDDAKVDAIKTGMLYSPAVPKLLEKKLSGSDVPLVVDPVLIAGVGDKLYSEGFVQSLKEYLFPMATVVTPNRHEAEVLSSMTIDGLADAERACSIIADLGPQAVLLKGGHFEGAEVIDVLYHKGRMYEFSAPRSKNKVHGSGCTLASFLACDLAKGLSLKEAALDAKRRITDSIAMAYPVGKGVMVINAMAGKQKEAMRLSVMEELRRAIAIIHRRIPSDSVPKTGLSMAYSLPSPQGFNDVCGQLTEEERREKGTDLAYGGSRETARALLQINRNDPDKRAGILLRGTDAVMNRLEPDRTGKQTSFVFVMQSSLPGMGQEPVVCVVGNDPDELLMRIAPILR